MTDSPKVFISYSHDDNEHIEWVYKLACKLVENGIETTFDQWDLGLGSNLSKFMEKGLTTNDRVLVICTEKYIDKANEGIGGVGYEKNILTSELLQTQDTKKFIPVIRNVSRTTKTPTCLLGRIHIDFSNHVDFSEALKKLLHEIYGVPLKPKPSLGKNPFKEEITAPAVTASTEIYEDSTIFFSRRFSSAFPGVRGIEWFKNSKQATDRLCILLKEPLVYKHQRPIWSWRAGASQISELIRLDESKVIIDNEELEINEIAAVNLGPYYQCFVYVSVHPSPPSGMNDTLDLKKSIERWGFAREEFAVYKDRLITRAEYDDSAAVIDGSPVELDEEAYLRARYLTPYNFIIAAQNSPINESTFDDTLDATLNEMLKGNAELDKFIAAFMKLPKRSPANVR